VECRSLQKRAQSISFARQRLIANRSEWRHFVSRPLQRVRQCSDVLALVEVTDHLRKDRLSKVRFHCLSHFRDVSSLC
jgi:hypothetical protein